MRILASNPDTIGDMLLRQPMYRALQAAGHELCLIIRPLLEPVVPMVAPGARIIVCSERLYEPALSARTEGLEGVIAQARSFEPDLLLIAPFQWTALDERLGLELAGVPCIAMTGKRFMGPRSAPMQANLRVTRSVPVTEEMPELAKNQALAAAVLGRAVELADPVLEAHPEQLEVADVELTRAGLTADTYWVACIGDSQFTRVRNWDVSRWAELLSHWARRWSRRFLLVGHESESATMREVAALMPEGAGTTAIWTGRGDGDLRTLIGLIARSRGYIGRDTGPMHIAAALGKPLLTVFGGGTWPRFLPAARTSVSLTLSVPCAGCGWMCHLDRSHCIKDVSVAEAIRAADDLESGSIVGRQTRVAAADGPLLAKIARAGAEVARERTVELAVLRTESKMPPVEPLHEALQRAAVASAKAEELTKEIERVKREAARREALLRQRLAAQESSAAAREDDLRSRLSEAEARLAIPAISIDQLEEVEAAHRERERELNTLLMKALADLNRRESSDSDLKLKLERLESDRRTLSALTTQQESEVVVLRERVNDLLSSRWRRYGQRLGLCMRLPWETDNGAR